MFSAAKQKSMVEATHIPSNTTASRFLVTLSLLALSVLTVGCGTGDGKTTVDASFTSNPQGGEYVQEVDAEFILSRSFEDESGLFESTGSPENVNVTVEWIFEPRTGTGKEVVTSDVVTLDSDSESFRASYSAGSGNVLLNYWSVRLTWTDDNGRKTQESLQALCTAPDLSAPSAKTAPVGGTASN